jgi:hypothetical protein
LARGNFLVDSTFENGSVRRLVIHSLAGAALPNRESVGKSARYHRTGWNPR